MRKKGGKKMVRSHNVSLGFSRPIHKMLTVLWYDSASAQRERDRCEQRAISREEKKGQNSILVLDAYAQLTLFRNRAFLGLVLGRCLVCNGLAMRGET